MVGDVPIRLQAWQSGNCGTVLGKALRSLHWCVPEKFSLQINRQGLEAGHANSSGDWLILGGSVCNLPYVIITACIRRALLWFSFVYCYGNCVQFLSKEHWNLAFFVKFYFRIHKGFHSMRFEKVLINAASMAMLLYCFKDPLLVLLNYGVI
jgi:hypothetical protein